MNSNSFRQRPIQARLSSILRLAGSSNPGSLADTTASNPGTPRCFLNGFVLSLLLLLLLSLLSLTASAQEGQPSLARYDVFAGFTDISSPALGLNQQGFHAQLGMNPRRWYSIGADYSMATGAEVLTTALLPSALQAQVNGAQAGYIAAGLLPSNYRLAVPTDALTQTIAFGPQLVYRRFSRLALFVRPSLGALREHAVPHAGDAFQTAIVGQLAPAGYKTDWTGFYGIGCGGEAAISRHLGIRVQLDAVYNHPFNDILANGRWTYRSSVGPIFHFGKDVPPGGFRSRKSY